MKIYDFHLHSNVSFDGRISIEDACSVAVRLGISGLTFTEHVEFTRPDRKGSLPDFASYKRQIEAARKAFPQLEIGMGLEIGMCHGHKDNIEEVVGWDKWDIILASLHTVDGLCAFNDDFTHGKDKKYAYRRYFSALYELIEEISCFDVLAHLDMIRRNSSYADRSLDYQDYAEELDAILRLLIKRGHGLEVNTAGWRFGIGGAHPAGDILKRYRELGGIILTCGSDSHGSAVAERILDGYQWIISNGFHHLALYRQRQPILMDLY